MGSDLARPGLPALNDLPPFRNASPGLPDSLPSLAQLGCPAPSSASSASSAAASPSLLSSWTAVNHPPQGSSSSALRDIDSIPDRAPDPHTDHHPPHAPICPNSTSHLGRRPHRPKLAPKRPIGSRQDSAASESPSPKVPAEHSPDAPDAAYGGASAASAVVDPLAQSPVLASSLGSSRHARAALHPLTNPHPPPDPPKYPQHPPPPPRERNHHHFPGTHHSSSSNGLRAGDLAIKGRRPRQPLLHKDHSPSASAAPPAFPKPLTLSRPRTRGARVADGRALFGEIPPVPVETMAEMAPPLVPPREHRFPSNVPSTTRKSPPSPFAFARPASYLSEAQPTIPHSADTASATSTSSSSSSSVSVAANGHARLTANAEPRPGSSTVRSNPSPSLQGNHASPAAASTMDELPRCQTCNQVYHPPPSMDPQTLRAVVTGIRPADAQSLDDYNQTMENFTDIIRGHIRHPDSDFNEWRERHRHDSEDTSVAPTRVAEAELQSEGFHSNKRRRLSDSENQPEHKRYYAYQPTSGDTVFVTRPIAALFPGDGVPREPYVPPPETNHNMWYIPPEEPKRKTRHHTGPDATPSEVDPQQGESASGHKDADESAPQPRRKSSGAAPLDKILHS